MLDSFSFLFPEFFFHFFFWGTSAIFQFHFPFVGLELLEKKNHSFQKVFQKTFWKRKNISGGKNDFNSKKVPNRQIFPPLKMWFLVDVSSKEKFRKGFSSQVKLARFIGIHPRTLNKAVKEGRKVFTFNRKRVLVVEEKVARFLVHESSSDPPLKSFEKETEVAEWFGLTRQAIYAAFGPYSNETERKIKKKWKGMDFEKNIGRKTNPSSKRIEH